MVFAPVIFIEMRRAMFVLIDCCALHPAKSNRERPTSKENRLIARWAGPYIAN
jgi:hypothetical protein